ncbi:MAG: cation-translocating P-type ATPase [Rickettsiales bacterium]|jgi:heavy metal translocating P-type ATPase|nr:cation-translocating P-type ATPase [Rickettsiales bacterium]
MIKKIINFFGKPAVVLISGLFLWFDFMGLKLAWTTIVICGAPILYSAIKNLSIKHKITSSLLVSIAIISSVMVDELFAAGEVAFIMAVGEILEEKTINRAKKGISKLINLTPKIARLVEDNKIIPVENITSGDILRVLPGEIIPIDGVIVSGDTTVDQSVITGESLPIEKTTGDKVFCGAINHYGCIDVEATKTGEDSSLQKLICLMKEAENNKAPIQRTADKWASYLVLAALLTAVGTYFITGSVIRAITVLIVFCPCALTLSAPIAVIAAIGQATKHGVLIKSGLALEEMGRVDCIAFDKTGTITHGRLSISDIIPFADIDKNDMLNIVASLEIKSEHLLAKTIVQAAKALNLNLLIVKDFKMLPGKGVSGIVDKWSVSCGNYAFMVENNVKIYNEDILENLKKQGKIVIFLAKDNVLLGVIVLTDVIRPTTRKMVEELKTTNIVLLTGDHYQTARYIAEQVGITEVYADLLPEQKVEHIKKLQYDRHIVCMVGDGINDAPALKTANVGIAMEMLGNDIAIEAADIVLLGGDMTKVSYLKKLSNITIKTIKLNISSSLVINFVAVTLSVLGLLTPMLGALAHNAGSILVVLNAVLLYDKKI